MLRPYLELPRAVHVLCLGTFINRAGTFVLPFLTLDLTRERGFTELQATSGAAVCGLGCIGASLVGGHLADHIGRRRVMLLALAGNAAVLLAFGYLTSPWTMLPCLFCFTFLADMYRPAASAMMSDLVEPARRSLSFGLMYSALNLGFAVGAVSGGIISRRLGFMWMFRLDAATSLVYAAIIFLLIRETLGAHAAPPLECAVPVEGDTVDPTTIAPPAAEPEIKIPIRAAAAHIMRDWVFLLFCFASFCIGTVFMQSMTTFPLYFQKHFGIDLEGYGWIIAVNGLMIALLQLPLTAAIQQFNRATMLVIGALAVAIGFGATEFAAAAAGFGLTVVIWTFGEMLMAPFNGPIVTDLAPPSMRARYFGVFGMSFAVAMTVSTPIGGWVLQRYGGAVLTRGCFVVGLFAVAILVGLHRHLQPRAAGQAVRTAA